LFAAKTQRYSHTLRAAENAACNQFISRSEYRNKADPKNLITLPTDIPMPSSYLKVVQVLMESGAEEILPWLVSPIYSHTLCNWWPHFYRTGKRFRPKPNPDGFPVFQNSCNLLSICLQNLKTLANGLPQDHRAMILEAIKNKRIDSIYNSFYENTQIPLDFTTENYSLGPWTW
jgi:hypothetical protein